MLVFIEQAAAEKDSACSANCRSVNKHKKTKDFLSRAVVLYLFVLMI